MGIEGRVLMINNDNKKYRKLSECGHLEDMTFPLASPFLSLLSPCWSNRRAPMLAL